MAPIKLEENIREKLEARELKPSADAWKKLEARLGEKQPKNHSYIWYYVAASFVGILIVASVFFSRNASERKNEIVEENIEQNNPTVAPEIVPNTKKVENVASEKVEKKTTPKENLKENNSKPLRPKKESAVDRKIRKDDALAEVSNASEKSEKVGNRELQKKEPIVVSEEDKLFDQKVNEVVADVKKLQNENTAVTAEEVDDLLKNARREIQTQRILSNPKVDATALLQDVEWELEKSFRDKVFDALGEGFQKIRTAVTERND